MRSNTLTRVSNNPGAVQKSCGIWRTWRTGRTRMMSLTRPKRRREWLSRRWR